MWRRLLPFVIFLAALVTLRMTLTVPGRVEGEAAQLPALLRRTSARPGEVFVPKPGGAGVVFDPSKFNVPAEKEGISVDQGLENVCTKEGMMTWYICQAWKKKVDARANATVSPTPPAAVPVVAAPGVAGGGGGVAPALSGDDVTLNAARAALSAHAGNAPGVDAFAAPPGSTQGGTHTHPGSSSSSGSSNGGGSSVGVGVADGDAADVRGHMLEEQCWHHFDLGFLEDWDRQRAMLCLPKGGAGGVVGGVGERDEVWEGSGEVEMSEKMGPLFLASRPFPTTPINPLHYFPSPALTRALTSGGGGGDVTPFGWLRCRVMTDSHLPPPTAPHTLCDGGNVVLNPALLIPTSCLPSRPGYKCDGPPVHWIFPPGSLSAGCTHTDALGPQSFPRDHLMDMFSGWDKGGSTTTTTTTTSISTVTAPGDVVLIVARERGEHANLFHSTSDWINAYISLVVAGVVNPLTGGREGMGSVQVLLMDEQTGPFEEAWYGGVFSPSHPVLRVSTLQAATTSPAPLLRMRRALFVPPGYTNFLLSHVLSEGDCHARTQLLQGWRRFALGGLGLKEPPGLFHHQQGGGGGGARARGVRVTLVSRRPYQGHGFVGRQMDNEEEVLTAIAQALEGAGESVSSSGFPPTVTRIDFAGMASALQAKVIAEDTDVLVGMHGAALTYASLLPPWGGLIELWPKDGDMWRCFEHLATMSGMFYDRWANRDRGRYREDTGGDYLTVDGAAVGELVVKAVQHALKQQ